jgi:lipopolysaccharide export LptBFGC system permease protein LptF
MRLLDRYLLRELLLPLGVCLSGFTLFWIAFDLLGDMTRFQKAGLGLVGVMEFYLWGLPELLNTTLPIALLLSLLYTLTHHARHHELTAIRAAGISLWRTIVPYLTVGLLLSLGLYWSGENLIPQAKRRQENLMLGKSANEKPSEAWRSQFHFENQTDRRSWSISRFLPSTGDMVGIRLLMPLGNGAHREVRIPSALWTNGAWNYSTAGERLWRSAEDTDPAIRETRFTPTPPLPGTNQWLAWPGAMETFTNGVLKTNIVFHDPATQIGWSAISFDSRSGELFGLVIQEPIRPGAQRQFLADGAAWMGSNWRFTNGNEYLFRNHQDREPLWLPGVEFLKELNETPDIIRSELRIADFNRAKAMQRPQLTLQEIVDYQHLHPVLKPDLKSWLDTQFHARLAAPWTCLVVVIIAVPFAAPSGRRNLFFGVAGSIGLAFIFFVVQRVGFAMGQNGIVPAWLGAWLPNLVFSLTGLILTARVR